MPGTAVLACPPLAVLRHARRFLPPGALFHPEHTSVATSPPPPSPSVGTSIDVFGSSAFMRHLDEVFDEAMAMSDAALAEDFEEARFLALRLAAKAKAMGLIDVEAAAARAAGRFHATGALTGYGDAVAALATALFAQSEKLREALR